MKTKPTLKRAFCVVLSIMLIASITAGCSSGGTKAQTTAAPAAQTTAASAQASASAQTTKAQPKQKITINIGSEQAPAAVLSTAMLQDFFVPEVTKRVAATTNYEVSFVESYSGTVAKLGEMYKTIKSGLLDIGLTVASANTTDLMPYNFAFYVPFASGDAVQVAKALQGTIADVPALKEGFQKNNQQYLGFATTDCYQLITNFPVNSLADLKGQKIAAVGTNQDILTAAGAVPISSSAGDAYTSIQTGVYKGWVFPVITINGTKLYEVAPYCTKVDVGCVLNFWLTANSDFMKKLPPEVRTIVEQVASEYILKTAEAANNKVSSLLETMQKNNGLKVSTLSAAERDKWINSLPELPAKFVELAAKSGFDGAAIINAYVANLKKQGVAFTREWKA